MKLKDIKVGRWYDTVQGIGLCLEAGRRTPPAVRMRIMHPIPRGVVYLAPRDVRQEVPDPTPLPKPTLPNEEE